MNTETINRGNVNTEIINMEVAAIRQAKVAAIRQQRWQRLDSEGGSD